MPLLPLLMTFNFLPKNKLLKYFLGSLLAFGVVVAASSWYLSYKFKPLIQAQLKLFALQATDSLYTVEFTDLNTNLILGKATILEVNIVPNATIYKKLIAQKKAPNNLYYIKLKEVVIRNFHLYQLLFNQKIQIDLLLFDKPEVVMVNTHFAFNENRPPRPQKSPYAYISKLFKSLRVKTVDFRNARFKYVNNNGKVKEVDSLSHLNVKLTDWLIDSLSAQDTSRLYLLKDINVNFNNYSYATPDSMYHIRVSDFAFNAASGKVNLKKFELMPRYSETNFPKVNGYARDRFFIQLNKINVDGINLPAYVQKRDVIARKVTVFDGEIAVFNDNRYPSRKTDKTGRFPHQLLQWLPFKLFIDSVKLKNINVSYAEFDRDSKQKGKITFQHTSGLVRNMTNFDTLIKQNPMMQASFISYVMGQGKLAVNFKFNLASPLGAFAYKGKVTNLDGRKLNEITKPVGMVRVNKADIKSLTFNVNADQNIAKGNMEFRYNNLSVALLKKERGNDRLVSLGLLSILANALVIYTDNPNLEGKFAAAPIYFKRVSTASFFSFIWRSLFQGIKYSVGVTPQKEAEIAKHIAQFEKMKKDREIRKKRREIRN